jgi:dTDP-4-amino-4,6-dideoxygalactose transaminase
LATQTLTHQSSLDSAPKLRFPFLDLKSQYAGIREEVMMAVTRVLESQNLILGPEVEALEHEVAEYVGARYAIGCASGSDALLLALMALGIGPGDEVITTPFTFGATAGSIARLNARAVFIDIDPVTFNLDPSRLEAAITLRTRAFMPVHLFGLPAQMDAIGEIARKHNLPVIEDAAQSIGSRWKDKPIGTLGDFGCFSFFPSKNLGGAGDGGMITTNNAEFSQRLKMLRAHGTSKKYRYECLGMNSRLDALQAAILRVKLQRLDEWTQARRKNAARYRQLFNEYGLNGAVRLPECSEQAFHVYNQYTVRVDNRDALQAHLRQQGIPTEIYYPGPLHLQPAFAYLGYREGDFRVTERACQEVLALPICPELTADHQRAVVEAISHFYR